MARIETGVDKLVDLVARRKKVTVEQAADELGVSTLVIQEWADFLEEEGVISIEYSLSKVYLTERKLSKKEVENKAKDYDAQKDAFVRKVETAMKSLQVETSDFDKIRSEFLKLRQGLGSEMDKIQEQLKEIKHYEHLKDNMDVEIAKQRQDYEKVLNSVSQEIRTEVKKYDEIIREIEREDSRLLHERDDMKVMLKQEDIAKDKLKDLAKALDLINKRIDDEKHAIENSEQKVENLSKMAKNVAVEIRQKTDTVIAPLIRLSEKNKEKVLKTQEDLLQKIAKRTNEIAELSAQGKTMTNRFSDFFEQKSNIDKLFKLIESDKIALQKELEMLIDAARSFNIASSNTEVKRHIGDLMKKFKEYEKKKGRMYSNMGKLSHLIRGK